MSKQTLPILRIAIGYQVKRKKRIIVEFSKQKDANRMRKVKKNLKGMGWSSIDIPSTVYINDSLCKYYKTLLWKCKKLCVNKFIQSFWVSNGYIRLKLSDNERSYMITHISDFGRAVPWRCIHHRWRISSLFSIVFHFWISLLSLIWIFLSVSIIPKI